MDPNKITVRLKCPVCLEIPKEEIYQCKNGHTICSQCCVRYTICPQCSLPYGAEKIRNQALESILDAMDFECSFRANGCTKLSKRNNLKWHMQVCTHREKTVNLCELMGYKCSFVLKPSQIWEALKHFLAAHRMLVCSGQQAWLILNNFKKAASSSKKSVWTPVIVKSDKEEWEKPVFIVLSILNAEDRSNSWVCLYLGESNVEAFKYEIQLKISSVAENWKLPSVGLRQAREILKSPPHRIQISFLMKHYENEGHLNATFKITREDLTETGASSNGKPLWLFNLPIEGSNDINPIECSRGGNLEEDSDSSEDESSHGGNFCNQQ